MTNAVFHPLAEQELIDAAAYYEEQNKGLELEYLSEVEHAVNFLISSVDFAKVSLSLLYRILDENQIRILAIAHHKCKPQYWNSRN